MKKEEKELFLELCKFKSSNYERLSNLINNGADTAFVLGHLFYNRMAATAYGVLESNGLLKYVGREFRTSLKNAWQQNKIKNESYFKCVKKLSDDLKELEGKYALLKGAYLCRWYPAGYRTSNDVDILAAARNVTEIGRCLENAGYKQGYLKGETFVPASRREIISSKMLRGETVPYIKEVDLPFMKYLEVDINFSLDYKNAEGNLVEQLVSRSQKTLVGDLEICTLEKYDFMIHLCEHLYKEATVYPWIKMKRDMTMYKFCDIYGLLCEYSPYDFAGLKERIERLNTKEACYYGFYAAREFFGIENQEVSSFINKITPEDTDILNRVIAPEEKKLYRYKEKNLTERFFENERILLLEEVV